MKRIKLSENQQTAFNRIVSWFLDPTTGATTCISDPHERWMTNAKIFSRLACLHDLLTDHINGVIKHLDSTLQGTKEK